MSASSARSAWSIVGDLVAELLGEVGQLFLLDQRQPGEVVAALGERQLGALGPARPAARRAARSGGAFSFWSAMPRAAEARTSTSVSSISRMITRIVLAGSSDRLTRSMTLAAMMSRVREKMLIGWRRPKRLEGWRRPGSEPGGRPAVRPPPRFRRWPEPKWWTWRDLARRGGRADRGGDEHGGDEDGADRGGDAVRQSVKLVIVLLLEPWCETRCPQG